MMTNNENLKNTLLTVEERLKKIAFYSGQVQRRTNQLYSLSLVYSDAVQAGYYAPENYSGSGELLTEMASEVNDKTETLMNSLYDLIKAINAKKEEE